MSPACATSKPNGGGGGFGSVNPEQNQPLPLPSQPAALRPPPTVVLNPVGMGEARKTEVMLDDCDTSFNATALNTSVDPWLYPVASTFRKMSKILGFVVAV